MAARALESLGVTAEAGRQQVLELVERADLESGMAFPPYSAAVSEVLKLAQREALDELGHDYIGTEHLLLGLIRQSDGVAVRVLADLGVGRRQVGQAAMGLLVAGTGSD